MKYPAFESLDEKMKSMANEIFPPLHPAWSGEMNQAYQDGFESGVIERDIQWHKKVEKLIQTLQEISKYKPVGMNVYDVAEGAVDSAKSALAEFYGEGKND